MNNELLSMACDLWREYQDAKQRPDDLTLNVRQLKEALDAVIVNLANQNEE